MSASFYDLLKYAQTGIASPDMTAFDKLRARAMSGGYPVQTLTGIPPLTFKSDGTPLISWSMLGNGQQTGTPTPDNPIMPEFVGVRTANLFDRNAEPSETSKFIRDDGTTESNSAFNVSDYISMNANTQYTLTEVNTSSTNPAICFYDASKQFISGVKYNKNRSLTVTTPSGTAYAKVSYNKNLAQTATMITAGTESPSEYEPYGWAEKFTCAGQTVPVYLGQTQTVRRVNKIVFTGGETENWTLSNSRFVFWLIGKPTSAQELVMCSHFIGRTPTYRDSLADGYCMRTINQNQLAFNYSGAADVDAFKSYLVAQYANGTPVTVWYVLATSETAIVNEPLCKIGDYADELSSTDAGVSIPTAKGQNTLTVDTELQPSEMTITYKG